MASQDRPLSPHLQVYRWQMTMALSILHRITGVGLGLGALLLVWWLVAAASGPAYFDLVNAVMTSWFGRLLMLGFAFALFLHLCNGLRHLVWDAGYGLEIESARAGSWIVIVAAVVLTLASFALGYAVR